MGGIPAGEALRNKEVWRSLLFLVSLLFCVLTRALTRRQVGVPYIRAKAQDYFEELGGGVSSDVLDEGLDARQIQMLTDQVSFSFIRFVVPIISYPRSRASEVGPDASSRLRTRMSTQLRNSGSFCGTLGTYLTGHHHTAHG